MEFAGYVECRTLARYDNHWGLWVDPKLEPKKIPGHPITGGSRARTVDCGRQTAYLLFLGIDFVTGFTNISMDTHPIGATMLIVEIAIQTVVKLRRVDRG
jgi:hypothetical protein